MTLKVTSTPILATGVLQPFTTPPPRYPINYVFVSYNSPKKVPTSLPPANFSTSVSSTEAEKTQTINQQRLQTRKRTRGEVEKQQRELQN
jgi:hypothetical protein